MFKSQSKIRILQFLLPFNPSIGAKPINDGFGVAHVTEKR